MRRAQLGLVAWIAGCQSTVSAPLPDLPSDTRSVLLVAAPANERAELFAFRWPEEHPDQLAVRAPTEMGLLAYARPLDALQITPGRHLDASDRANARALPSADQIWVTEVEDGGPGDWAPREALDGALGAFRLPDGTVESCAAARGCFVDRTDQELGLCRSACPTPTAPGEPTAPEPTLPPILTPCPTGWRTVDLDGADVCLPPERTCDGHQFIDSETCGDVGATCPPDGWPRPTPIDRPVRYVDTNAAPNGDGSRASPFDSVAAAVANGSGTFAVALRAGEHLAPSVRMTGDVVVLGACAAETFLRFDDQTWTVEGATAALSLAEVTVVGGAPAIDALESTQTRITSSVFEGGGAGGFIPIVRTRDVTLERVAFYGTDGPALRVIGGRATVQDVIVRDATHGIELIFEARGELNDVVLEDIERTALRVAFGTVTATRAYIRGSGEAAAVGRGTLRLSEVIVDGEDRGTGFLGEGGTLILDRVAVRRAVGSGVTLVDASAVITHTVVSGSVPDVDGVRAAALVATSGARVRVDRLRATELSHVGILLRDGSELEGEHVFVARVGRSSDGVGDGVVLDPSAALNVEHARIEAVSTAAVVFDPLAPCASSSTFRLLHADVEGAGGGVRLRCDRDAHLERVRLRSIEDGALDLHEDVRAVVLDLDVDGAGTAVATSDHSTLLLDGARIRDTDVGVIAEHDSAIEVAGGRIDCGGGGVGVTQRLEGATKLRAFVVERCDVGIRTEDGVDIGDGVVRENTVAIESVLPIEAFLLGVIYVDNATLISAPSN